MSAILLDRIPERVYDVPMKQQISRYSGDRIKPILAAQGRRQDWLAAQVGVSQTLISRLLSGKRTVDVDTAKRIANVLQVPFFVAFEFPNGSEMLPNGVEERAA
jgi:transcriptional regulator with XRE-family HTH domain